eukprot:gene2516-13169_t
MEFLPGLGAGSRRVRTAYGVQFKLDVGGKVGTFSAAALGNVLVMKLGLLSVFTLCIELAWQFAFPLLLGVDYNPLVYREVDQIRNSP